VLNDAVLVTIVRSFFGVDANAQVRLAHNRDDGTVTGSVNGSTCILEPRPVLPRDDIAAMLDISGVRPRQRDWNIELVGVRLAGGPSCCPRALDAGFAVFSDGELLRLSSEPPGTPPTAGLAGYWQRIGVGTAADEPVALANAMVLFARQDLGVQNLVVARYDVAMWLDDATLASVDGFTELECTRGVPPALDLRFCSFQLRMPEISLLRWEAHVNAAGALRYEVAPIAENLRVHFTPLGG
jgi:hypothetical protein